MDPPPQASDATPIQAVPTIETTSSTQLRQLSLPFTPSPAPKSTPAPKRKPLPIPASTTTPTPTPAPESALKRKTWTKLTPDDHLVLLNHVCDHMGDFASGRIQFWKTMSELFEEDTGLSIL
jgi:hypothetical protein